MDSKKKGDTHSVPPLKNQGLTVLAHFNDPGVAITFWVNWALE